VSEFANTYAGVVNQADYCTDAVVSWAIASSEGRDHFRGVTPFEKIAKLFDLVNVTFAAVAAINPAWANFVPFLMDAQHILDTANSIYAAGKQVYAVFAERSEWRDKAQEASVYLSSYNMLMDYQACTVLSQVKALVKDENKLIEEVDAKVTASGVLHYTQTDLNIRELYEDICD
jgi:hypothetical protein